MEAPDVGTAERSTAIQSAPPAPVVTPPAPPLSPPPAAPSVFLQACPPPAQWALGGLLLVATALLAASAYGFLPLAAHPSQLEPGEPLTYKLDLNLATRTELLQLPGVGPKMADRILDYRDRHGKFRSVADLMKIHGIGPITLKRLEGWVRVEGEPESPPAPEVKAAALAEKPRPAAKPAAAKVAAGAAKSPKADALKGAKINVNTATAEQLQLVPSIGPVISQRIIEERARKPFQSVDDLKRVKGIGPKTLENIRPFVTVGD